MTYNSLSSRDVRGRLSSSTQGMLIGSFEVLPEPTQYEYGLVAQYLGNSDNGLIRNHLYRCVSVDGVYQWEDATPVVDLILDPVTVVGTNQQGMLVSTHVTVGDLECLSGIESNVQEQLDTIVEDTARYLSEKVDKVEGMGLSEDNFTTREKEKLSSIAFGAQVNNIEEIQINNVTVQPEDKIVNLSMLEGHTYPIGDLTIGREVIVDHRLIRPIFSIQVRDGNGNVVKGDLRADDQIASILPDQDATDCTMYLIAGGI